MKQYVAFSGGKDSTAMLLRMIELGERIDGVFFADTNLEWDILHEYIDKIERLTGLKVERLSPPYELKEGMFHVVTDGDHKGEYRGFPVAFGACYFMRDAKYDMIRKKVKELAKEGAITCIGYAYGEQRAKPDPSVRTPLKEWGWSEERCVKYLNSQKILNPLYINFNRIGCIPCPHQNDASLYVIWKQHPKQWELIREFNALQNKARKQDILFVDGYFSDIEEKFEKGYVPRKRPKYACVDCFGVTKCFTDQLSMDDFLICQNSNSENKDVKE